MSFNELYQMNKEQALKTQKQTKWMNIWLIAETLHTFKKRKKKRKHIQLERIQTKKNTSHNS